MCVCVCVRACVCVCVCVCKVGMKGLVASGFAFSSPPCGRHAAREVSMYCSGPNRMVPLRGLGLWVYRVERSIEN